jgi:hypothetical protein
MFTRVKEPGVGRMVARDTSRLVPTWRATIWPVMPALAREMTAPKRCIAVRLGETSKVFSK